MGFNIGIWMLWIFQLHLHACTSNANHIQKHDKKILISNYYPLCAYPFNVFTLRFVAMRNFYVWMMILQMSDNNKTSYKKNGTTYYQDIDASCHCYSRFCFDCYCIYQCRLLLFVTTSI